MAKIINESVQHVLGEFGIISELYEPRYPTGVKHSIHTKPGAQGSAIKRNQYAFTTSKGNVVKVLFKVEDDSADVIFYVNDTLDDDASGGTDPEILSGVLGVVDKVADRRKFNTLTFEAWRGQGDTKKVTGLKEDREAFEKAARPVLAWTEANEPEMLPPTEAQIAMARKFDREATPRPSWQKDAVDKALGHLMAYYNDGSPLFATVVYELENEPIYGRLGKIIPGWDVLLKEARKVADARMSNTESGLTVRRNRRGSVYDRLLQRFMADKWNIEKSWDSYTLTRKVPV